MAALVRDPDNIRIAMLGMIEGNGHPYSWSAIINGRYDTRAMARCPYPVIPQYLSAQPLGALGIFFDWGPQALGILDGLRLSDAERARTRALLLDAEGLVLAASDRTGVLTERVRLRTDGRDSGFYRDGDALVGFAQTPGYETYAGLGWYGALVQHP